MPMTSEELSGLMDALTSRGATLECLACGETDPRPQTSLYHPRSETDRQSIECLTILCGNCGFIRHHATSKLK